MNTSLRFSCLRNGCVLPLPQTCILTPVQSHVEVGLKDLAIPLAPASKSNLASCHRLYLQYNFQSKKPNLRFH